MNASTPEFRALEERVAVLKTELDYFRAEVVPWLTKLTWDHARERITGIPPAKPQRPLRSGERHLKSADGSPS